MTTSYPSGIDNFTNPGPSDYEDVVSHSAQHSNANDAIEAIESVLGTTAGSNLFTTFGTSQKAMNYSGTPAVGDVAYYNGTAWTSLVAGTAAASKYLTTNGTTPSWGTVSVATQSYGTDGWIAYSGSLTVASGTTVTATGDLTSLWKKGTKVKFTQAGTTYYAYNYNSAYGSPSTTLTWTRGSGTIGTSSLSNVYYSYADAQGFPDYFDITVGTWTTSGTAFTNQPTTPLFRMAIVENRCWLWGIFLTSGTSGGSGIFKATLQAGQIPNRVDNSLGNSMNVSDPTMTGVCYISNTNEISIQKYDGTRIAGNSAYFDISMWYMF
jgi:hypothetical protein